MSAAAAAAPSTSGARKWPQLLLLAAAQLLAMGLWFSASAVVPQLTEELDLDGGQQAWLTTSVQLGFVGGALIIALLNLADRVPAPRLIAVCTVLGAASNALIPVLAGRFGAIVFLRFLTGAALAGVYPPAMKLVATWCRRDRGLGIGLLVAAITFGSAMPHLLNALAQDGGGMPPWRPLLWFASVLATAGAVIVAAAIRPGPHLVAVAPFDWRFAGRALAHRPTRLANLGYLGHMWELYAMWTWVPVLLLATYREAGWSTAAARLAGFATIAIGAVGSLLAGRWADRFGRTLVAGSSLAVSGGCCLVAGLLTRNPGALTALCLVWGLAVVADSAQFSAAVSELTDPRYVGTALTVQTSLGFLLTTVTIRLVPPLVESLGWERVFWLLAAGPAVGLWSMVTLRRLPEAAQMAGGHR